MELSARSGQMSIVASGNVTTFNENPLELTVWASEESRFVLKWSFDSQSETEDVSVNLTKSGSEIHLICTNFDTAEGRGTRAPLQLVDVGSRRFWLHFRVFLHGKSVDRDVQYTLYVEDL
jgi:hypothetical protein